MAVTRHPRHVLANVAWAVRSRVRPCGAADGEVEERDGDLLRMTAIRGSLAKTSYLMSNTMDPASNAAIVRLKTLEALFVRSTRRTVPPAASQSKQLGRAARRNSPAIHSDRASAPCVAAGRQAVTAAAQINPALALIHSHPAAFQNPMGTACVLSPWLPAVA